MGNVYLNSGGTSTTSGAVGIPPSICTQLRKTQSDTTVNLRWCDPADTVIDGLYLCSWAKTVIVRKKGSYPDDETDGTVIVTNTTRNAYSLTAYVDTLPDTENEYYYKAFPISVNGAVNLDPQNKFGQVVYEFIINPNNSDPATCITYAGTNADFEPAYMDYDNDEFNYGDWGKAFFMGLFRPCMLDQSGEVAYYLNPDDYSLQADGITPSDITDTSTTYNAMVEVGQIWIKEVLEDGGAIHVYIANEQISSDYDCYTHLRTDGEYNDYYYRAIYDGSNIDSVIRSLSGQTICKTVAGSTQMSYAQANGDGWNVDEYNFRRLINYLLLLIGKSTDTQTVFGTGRYSGGSSSSNNQLDMGTLDQKGMFWGDDSNSGVKVFYMENWWGNIWKFTNGILQSGGTLYYKMCEGTYDGSTVEDYQSTSVDGYIDSGVTLSGTSGGYISSMTLVPHLGLVPCKVSGSSSTYYPDGCWWSTSVLGFARFGSNPADDLSVGAFAFVVHYAVSHSIWTSGVTLSYKPS